MKRRILSIRGLLSAAFLLVGMANVCLAQTVNVNIQQPTRTKHAPEIDLAAGATALALLAGGILVIRGRRR
jgi:hypothetical protein